MSDVPEPSPNMDDEVSMEDFWSMVEKDIIEGTISEIFDTLVKAWSWSETGKFVFWE